MKWIQTACLISAMTMVWSLVPASVLGQSSNDLLSALSEKAKTYDSVLATYTSTLTDKVADFEAVQNGTIRILGDHYHLDLGDYVVISNGQSVWTYDVAMHECMVDDAEALAEDGLDPSKLFTIWENDFKNEDKGTVQMKGRSVRQINLYPNNPEDKAFHTIVLYIDESAMEMVRAVVKGREGTDVEYDVNTFEPGATIHPEIFSFREADFPGVTVIDNRL
ncbi:MAG: LolA family protein [Flavobacteriales bacterium]